MSVEEFKVALAVDPDHLAHNVHLHLGLCKVLVKLGRGKDALESCSEALKINEELVEALVQVCYEHHCPFVLFFTFSSTVWLQSASNLSLNFFIVVLCNGTST